MKRDTHIIHITQGLYSLRRRRLTGIGTPNINLRRSDDRLRFIMGSSIVIRDRLLSEKRPRKIYKLAQT